MVFLLFSWCWLAARGGPGGHQTSNRAAVKAIPADGLACSRRPTRLVKMQLAKASTLLRDLTYTAWIESAKPVTRVSAETNPITPANPHYNPETGTAPPGPAVKRDNH